MKIKSAVLTLLLIAVLSISSLAADQPLTLQDVFSGKTHPLSLTLKDLDGQWRQVKLSVERTGSLDGYGDYRMEMLADGYACYYTKGETVAAGSSAFILTYKTASSGGILDLFGHGDTPDLEPFTPATKIELTLIDVATIDRFTDIRPFNLETEIAQRKELIKAVNPESDNPLSNLKDLTVAVEQYAMDYDGKLPPMESDKSLQEALMPYVKEKEGFADPKTGKLYMVNKSLSGKVLAKVANPDKTVIFYQAEAGADGMRAVGYVNTDVAWVDKAQWAKIKTVSGIR